MTYTNAIAQVEKFLTKYADKDTSVRIYKWPDSTVGIRVAEVSFFTDNAGASYMQSDLPYGLAVCAQVERYIIALVEETDEEEELSRLAYLLDADKVAKG